jgi:hypothetical protein
MEALTLALSRKVERVEKDGKDFNAPSPLPLPQRGEGKKMKRF